MAAGAAASWEGWSADWSRIGERAADGDAIEPEVFDYNTVSPDVAGEELVEMLCYLKITGVLSAKMACVLAWWAAKAGATGEVAKLGVRPDKTQTGAYSKHFDTWSGSGPKSMATYPVSLGRKLRFEASRRWDQLPMRLPHQALQEELNVDGEDLNEALQEATRTSELPVHYIQHPAVRAAGPGLIHPATLYLDGVPYSRRDTVLGVWVQLMYSQKRHLCFSIRKSELCGCGCRGQCSLGPMFDALAWDLETMLRGTAPNVNHNGGPLTENDAGLVSIRGSSIGFRALVVAVKADWSEWTHTMGFPSWADSRSPCPLCFALLLGMCEHDGFSPSSMPPPQQNTGALRCRMLGM